MEQNNMIIDYIIDQAERYDGRNLQLEHDAIHAIRYQYGVLMLEIGKILSVNNDISTLLKIEKLLSQIDGSIGKFSNQSSMSLAKTVDSYMNTGYEQMDDLIQMGHELENKYQKLGISEMQKKIEDPDTINFMRSHAMEQVRGMSSNMLLNIRSRLSEMYLRGNVDKKSVIDVVSDIVSTNASRAEMIAQTELSMAYNNGAIKRIDEYNKLNPGRPMQKYWHGFKYSVTTCTYCRPRIGNKYDINDNSEHLPAHPRCRCIWLPILDGWDKPLSSIFTRNADMLKRVYSPQEIYNRINIRLGIKYAEDMPIDMATKYISGERTQEVNSAIKHARDKAISNTIENFNIASENAQNIMSTEFNTQMRFWKDYVSKGIVDNDTGLLSKSYEAIKGVMVLPWSGEQLNKWNKLLDIIMGNM